jgi:hypothetical protein
LAEIHQGSWHARTCQEKALKCYREAQALSSELEHPDSQRLELALALSAFYFEQMHAPEMAFKYTAEAVISAKANMSDFVRSGKCSDQEV